jgi:transforming growth factor-beta-induced protein
MKDIPTTLEEFGTTEASQSFSIVGDTKSKPNKPSFKTLKAALAKTGLMGVVSSSELTLFAPTDDAFAALGLNQQNISTVPNLKEILLYHVLEGKIYSTDLYEGFFGTLNGAAVEISLDGGVFVNDAEVIYADIMARNGVVHVIDQVLFPPTMNLVQLAQSFDPDEFTILVAAVVAAGLDDDLSGDGPFTVFAPTDAAFNAAGVTLQNVASVPNLTEILLYHVVEGRVFSSDLTTGPVPTLNGGATIYIDAQALTIDDAGAPGVANLVPSLLNVQATNGVVHVIDKVLFP